MIVFTVDGPAVPKQRPRISGRTAYTPKKTRDYEERVREAFRSSRRGFLPVYPKDVPVKACIEIIQAIPKSWGNTKRTLAENGEIVPISRNGDVDNIAKSILDALNGYVYLDDCQVTTLIVHKQYGIEPHVIVQFDEDN